MKRAKIGLVFSYSEAWIGGTYYILNLVRSLETLPEADAPEIYLLHTKPEDFAFVQSETNYPRLLPLLLRSEPPLVNLFNRVGRKFFRKDLWPWKFSDPGLDFLFPSPGSDFFSRVNRRAFWIPDFQELHLPHLFSPHELETRKANLLKIVATGLPVVVSSLHAKKDFVAHCPGATNAVTVLPFAVSLPVLDLDRIPRVQEKYGLLEPYFFCANQFWAHKNHLRVLEALSILGDRGVRVLVAFSGKQEDTRNPDFFPSLLKFIEEQGLTENVRFLGFIDRTDQLLLMKGSQAVIQPSLFEGWSTVVEDCKALGVPLIASRIEVHLEQAPPLGRFFDPNDAQDLASLLVEPRPGQTQGFAVDYPRSVAQFAQGLMGLVLPQKPRVSVVTVTWNSLAGLKRTNASLKALGYLDPELILVDALSTDGTQAFAESSDCLYRKIIIEKDDGIYDAMNKAIALATGDYVIFMNAGDRFDDDVDWPRLVQRLAGRPTIWIGDLKLDDGGAAAVTRGSLTFRHLLKHSLPHQAAFIPRLFFSSIGSYDRTYKISADQEWFLRALSSGLPFDSLGCPVAHYAGGGVSQNPGNQPILLEERTRMLRQHLGRVRLGFVRLVDGYFWLLDSAKDLMKRSLRRGQP